MSFETFISWRYFQAKRKQAFVSLITVISLAGVTVGVTALIVVLAVMSGVQETWKTKILGVNSHIVLLRYGRPLTNHQQVLQQVQAVENVASAEPFIYSQVMLSGFGGVSGAVLKGVDPLITGKVGHLAYSLVSGRLKDLGEDLESPGPGPANIILGQELAQILAISIGDSIKVVSPTGRINPLGIRSPRSRDFKVVGIFKSGMYEYDSTLAYISLTQAQEFLNLGDGITGLEIKVDDIYSAAQTKKLIVDKLDGGYWARDWMEMNRNLFWALRLEKFAMFVILTLIVLVAALNIVSTLIITVMEKTRDIAILKSMGATDFSVMKIFVYQGLVIGIGGTVLGFIGGLSLCQVLARYQFIKLPSDIYYIDTLPVRVEFLDIGLVMAMTIGISFLATLYPAWRAARLNPVEALRYE